MSSADRRYEQQTFPPVEPRFIAGLAFIGREGDREAYRLPFATPLSSSCLSTLKRLAQTVEGNLSFTPNLCIYAAGEPLLEICGGQVATHLLVPATCRFKSYLLQSTFEALTFGAISHSN